MTNKEWLEQTQEDLVRELDIKYATLLSKVRGDND